MLNKLKKMMTLSLFLTILIMYSHECMANTKTRQEYEQTGQVIWEVKTKNKVIALTFDDGPHPRNTPLILDLLKENGVQATFFVTGENLKKYPHIAQEAVNLGHEIGNHTYSHTYSESITKDTISQEIKRTNTLMSSILGQTPIFFRPVGGYHNDDIISAAVEQNHLVVLWSWHQDPRDWARPGAYKISQHILKNSRPGDIILLHDGGGNRIQTVEALRTVIPLLKEQGYTFVTLSELISENAN